MRLSLNIFLYVALAHAGTVPFGGNCTIANNRLDPATHKFLTDCDDTTFCTPQNTCQPKQCRRDEFPFGYPPNATLPPLCPHGQYCPDEGNSCMTRLALGQMCQLNRDDECAPPFLTASSSSQPIHLNEQSPMKASAGTALGDIAICLHSVCMYANATLGTQFSTTVTRDNCRRPGLFCSAGVCVRALDIGQPCQRDQECMSYNCNIRNVCANPPATPVKVPTWQYVLTGVTVLVSILATCVILISVHKRHRRLRYAEARDYYREQLGYRKSIIALHSVAASSSASSVYTAQGQASLESVSKVNAYGLYDEDNVARHKWRD